MSEVLNQERREARSEARDEMIDLALKQLREASHILSIHMSGRYDLKLDEIFAIMEVQLKVIDALSTDFDGRSKDGGKNKHLTNAISRVTPLGTPCESRRKR